MDKIINFKMRGYTVEIYICDRIENIKLPIHCILIDKNEYKYVYKTGRTFIVIRKPVNFNTLTHEEKEIIKTHFQNLCCI